MSTLEVHDIATLFPVMSEVDRDHLRESIAREGQLEEILLFEGQILDGRHRYETCVELGIEPRVREFEGSAAEAFSHSVALNLSRRHLTTVQRAAAGAGIKEFQAKILTARAEANAAGSSSEPIDVSIAEDAPSAGVEGAPSAESASSEADSSETESGASDSATSDSGVLSAAEIAAEAGEGKRRKPSARTLNAKAREIASRQVGVSGRAIEDAARIKHEAPDVFERMLEGRAGSLPDAKRVTALPEEQRHEVHRLVDEGTKLKAALKQVAPPPPPEPGPLFLGRVVLDPEDARAFNALLEERGIKARDAVKEAIVDWVVKHTPRVAKAEAELAGAGA